MPVIGIHSRIGGKVSSNVHVPIDTYRDTWVRLAAATSGAVRWHFRRLPAGRSVPRHARRP